MKRDIRLRGLSSDHHHALVLARRLRSAHETWSPAEGAALRAELRDALEPHFRIEEEVLLPALAAAGAQGLVQRTLEDHAHLRAEAALAGRGDAAAALAFAERMFRHVRFEEDELFPACEARLPPAVLDEAARRAPHPGAPARPGGEARGAGAPGRPGEDEDE